MKLRTTKYLREDSCYNALNENVDKLIDVIETTTLKNSKAFIFVYERDVNIAKSIMNEISQLAKKNKKEELEGLSYSEAKERYEREKEEYLVNEISEEVKWLEKKGFKVLKEAKTTNSVYLYSFDEESKTITTIRVSDHSNHSLFYSWSDNEWESFALENFNVEDVNVEEEDDIIIDFNCTFDEWLSLEDGKTFELLN